MVSRLRGSAALPVDVQEENVLSGGKSTKSLKESGSFTDDDANGNPGQVPAKHAGRREAGEGRKNTVCIYIEETIRLCTDPIGTAKSRECIASLALRLALKSPGNSRPGSGSC